MQECFLIPKKNYVECSLCPHNCKIKENSEGLCGVRGNRGGAGTLLYYGCLTAESIDPMEKKPLYHFLPGEKVYSVGFIGCNLKCPFCQNSSISQNIPLHYTQKSPEELVDAVVKSLSPAIAFTYSEPLIHFEYILKVSQLAKDKGIRTVLITNGMINSVPALQILPFIDAVNIDLKSFNDEKYRIILKGNLNTVKEFISLAAEYCHVEVTTLIVPELNDSVREIESMAQFLFSVNPHIVYHLSAYYPSFKYLKSATSHQLISNLAKVAGRYLPFVYKGNMDSDNSLHCTECGEILIKRRGYSTQDLTSPRGVCRRCHTPAEIIY